MLASSPVKFPATSSPPAAKRPRPQQDVQARPKPKTRGGFMMDDSSDEDEADEQPPLKKQLTEPITRPSLASQAPLPSTQDDLIDFQPTPLQSQEEQEPPSTFVLPELYRPRPSVVDTLPFSESIPAFRAARRYTIRTCDGSTCPVKERKKTAGVSYESMVAARTKTKDGRAKRGYYGIDINDLMTSASIEIAEAKARAPREPEHTQPLPSVELQNPFAKRPKKTMLWTEKYRAKTFMDLCGDDATNRNVLRWLKRWDPIVFPGAAKKVPAVRKSQYKNQAEEEKPHRKILMLTGPPGLGKTTLAHVCARQAGYEVMEINASDERSRDVVKNRIRTSLGTESVKTVANKKSVDGDTQLKVARPACVVVDEVDGVVSGAGGSGEGGFVKALIDLVLLDQKNSSGAHKTYASRNNKKADDFRLMRPLILICNDVYHPSLKPLRQSGLAEIVHAGKPAIESVVSRLKSVFDKEGIPCEKDAARKVCEAAWGMANSIDARKGAHSGAEGDLRGVMVVGEWVAGRYRSMTLGSKAPLTRQWLDKHVVQDLANGAGGARGAGRGSARDIVTRVFQEGGGFPKQALDTSQATKHQHEQPKAELGFSEFHKKNAMERLQQMVNTSGEIDRIVTDILLEYPNRDFNDDSFLTKPNEAYEWANFHDACSSRLFSSQEWELGPYVGQPVLAYHHLFASPRRHVTTMGFDKKWGDVEEEETPIPFSGPRADFEAFEAERQNRTMLQAIQSQLTPTLMRSFRSPEDVAAEFLPYLVRMLSPDVKPVVVGGSGGQGVASVRKESEKAMVRRAADAMADTGIAIHKGKIESEGFGNRPQWVYRMEPDIDALAVYETAGNLISSQAPTRFAVRQVLDQELQASIARREKEARLARFKGDLAAVLADKENDTAKLKAKALEKQRALLMKDEVRKDFFGRVVAQPLQEIDGNSGEPLQQKPGHKDYVPQKVWVTFNEGLNNAVRKPISLSEFMRGL